MLTYTKGREISYRLRLVFVTAILAAALGAAGFDYFLTSSERYDLRLGWKSTLISYTPTLLERPHVQVGARLLLAEDVARAVWAKPEPRKNLTWQLVTAATASMLAVIALLFAFTRLHHSKQAHGQIIEVGRR